VSQQPAFPVFCFEGQKVPYPASSFLPDTKLSWRKCHYYEHGRVGSDKTILNKTIRVTPLLYLVLLLLYLHKIVSHNFCNGNGLLFHMTQPTNRSTIKAIACSKPIISKN